MSEVPPLDPARDHVRGGGPDAPYELLLYGDYECPYTRRAMGFVKALEQRFGSDLRFAYCHFPLPDHHPRAEHAAQAAESAAQGDFWGLHDRLFKRPDELSDDELAGHAAAVGLDADRVRSELASGVHAERVRRTSQPRSVRGSVARLRS